MKWQAVKAHNLCRTCLNRHSGKCFNKNNCGLKGCTARHHQLLHKEVSEDHPASTIPESATQEVSASINSHSTNAATQLFRIVPVRVQKLNGYVNTFAFLDEGSSVTLIEQELFDTLDIKGVSEPLCLKWTGDTTRQEDSSVKATINIANNHSGAIFKLTNVHTVRSLDLPSQTINQMELCKKYPYLTGIPIQSYVNAKPSMIIGVDNWRVAVPLKIREGSWGQPIATKTRLGWAIQGNSGNIKSRSWVNIHTCGCKSEYDKLHQMIKDSFTLESATERVIMSPEDTQAMETLKTSCHKVGNRYEVGLLWKNKSINYPKATTMRTSV